MAPGENIESEVNRMLESINGITRAEAPAFFYTRLRALIDSRRGSVRQFFTRPVLSLAVLLLMLVLNITAIAHYVKAGGQKVAESGMQSLASEMSTDLSSVYAKTNN